MSVRISLCIPTTPERGWLLDRTIASLRPNLDRSWPHVEICLGVDTDDEAAFEAVSLEGGLHASKSMTGKPRGRGIPHRNHARNEAANLAKGEWLWFLDDDMMFPPNGLIDAYAMVKSAPRSSVFSPCIGRINCPPARWKRADWADWPRKKKDLLREPLGFLEKADETASAIPFDHMAEGMPLVHRDLFWALRGFDERFIGWGGDKLEFVQRIRRLHDLGILRCFLSPRILLAHQPHERDENAYYNGTPAAVAVEALFEDHMKEVRDDSPPRWWAAMIEDVKKATYWRGILGKVSSSSLSIDPHVFETKSTKT